jgi:hypothetical protein
MGVAYVNVDDHCRCMLMQTHLSFIQCAIAFPREVFEPLILVT